MSWPCPCGAARRGAAEKAGPLDARGRPVADPPPRCLGPSRPPPARPKSVRFQLVGPALPPPGRPPGLRVDGASSAGRKAKRCYQLCNEVPKQAEAPEALQIRRRRPDSAPQRLGLARGAALPFSAETPRIRAGAADAHCTHLANGWKSLQPSETVEA
ncbi:Protein of unknown function, partial [Gryllus bimaculatus]